MYKALIFLISFSVSAAKCPVGYLCATGCGLHESEADAQARSQIGKMFKVRIESSFTSARAHFGALDEGYAHEVINEYVDQNLEGVSIVDRREEDDAICATAQLNKVLFSESIKKKIFNLNKESKNLIASGKKLIWERVRENNSKAKQLGSLLSVIEVDAVSTKFEVPSFKKEEIKLNFNNEDNVKNIKSLVEARILRNGFLNSDKAKNELNVKIVLKKLQLNISGFEKFEMLIHLDGSYNDKKTKAFKSFVAHGRSKDQVIGKIKKQFNENLSQLFIDLGI